MRRISDNNLYYVYILTNIQNKVLYVGMTSNVEKRIYEHKNKLIKGFTAKYNVYKLIFVEHFKNPLVAFQAERKLKGWTRAKKIALINTKNPLWNELIL